MLAREIPQKVRDLIFQKLSTLNKLLNGLRFAFCTHIF